jgi:vancomycin permeability regulator SanA
MIRRTKVILLASVAAIASLAAIAGCNAIVWREGRARVRAASEIERADAIVVLGAGVRDDGSPSHVLVDRLEIARELYRTGAAPRVLVTGDHVSASYDEPRTMQRWLVDHGVPREAIFLDHAGVDTYSSMWRARHVFQVRRAIVVTQRFHLPRALFLGARLGMDVTVVEADRRAYVGSAWFQVREIASRTKAWLDVAIGRTPRIAGPPIPIDGDAHATEG